MEFKRLWVDLQRSQGKTATKVGGEFKKDMTKVNGTAVTFQDYF